jgi:hypothetical protein
VDVEVRGSGIPRIPHRSDYLIFAYLLSGPNSHRSWSEVGQEHLKLPTSKKNGVPGHVTPVWHRYGCVCYAVSSFLYRAGAWREHRLSIDAPLPGIAWENSRRGSSKRVQLDNVDAVALATVAPVTSELRIKRLNVAAHSICGSAIHDEEMAVAEGRAE